MCGRQFFKSGAVDAQKKAITAQPLFHEQRDGDLVSQSDGHRVQQGLGVGRTLGRATYQPVTDAEAMEAFRLLCRTEGIIPAIESAHALAGALRVGRAAAEAGRTDHVILVNLSGRGDKDVATAARWFDLVDDEAIAETATGTEGQL